MSALQIITLATVPLPPESADDVITLTIERWLARIDATARQVPGVGCLRDHLQVRGIRC